MGIDNIQSTSKRASISPAASPHLSNELNIPNFDLAVLQSRSSSTHSNTSHGDNEFVAMSPELLAESLDSAEYAVHSGLLQSIDGTPNDDNHSDVPHLSLDQHVSPGPAMPHTSRMSTVVDDDNSMTTQIRGAIDRCFVDAGIDQMTCDNIYDVLTALSAAQLNLFSCQQSSLGSYDIFIWRFKCLGQLELCHSVNNHNLTVHKIVSTHRRQTYIDTSRFKELADTLGRQLMTLNRLLCDSQCKPQIDEYMQSIRK